MGSLLSFSFWFKMRPGVLLPIYQKALIAIIIIMGVSFFIFTIISKRKSIYNKIHRSLKSFGLANAIIGALILFFTFEMVPLLSSRFWFLVWGIEIAIWAYFMARTALEIPKRRDRIEKEKEFNKYIP